MLFWPGFQIYDPKADLLLLEGNGKRKPNRPHADDENVNIVLSAVIHQGDSLGRREAMGKRALVDVAISGIAYLPSPQHLYVGFSVLYC